MNHQSQNIIPLNPIVFSSRNHEEGVLCDYAYNVNEKKLAAEGRLNTEVLVSKIENNNIAVGNVGGAIKFIEGALGSTITMIMSFLANYIGLGGIATNIKKIISKVTDPINKALEKAVGFVAGKVRQWFGKEKKEEKSDKTEKGSKPKDDKRTQDEMKKDLHLAVTEGTDFISNGKKTKKEIDGKLNQLEQAYQLEELKLVVDKHNGEKDVVHIHGKVNPVEDGVKEEIHSSEVTRPQELIGKPTPKLDKLVELEKSRGLENEKTSDFRLCL